MPESFDRRRRDFLKGCGSALAIASVPHAAAEEAREQNSGAGVAKAGITTALIHDDAFKTHLTGEGHPESPARYSAVMDALLRSNFASRLLQLKPRAASDEELQACHPLKYIQIVERDIALGSGTLSTGDTAISPRSLIVARQASGAVLNAVDEVVAAKVRNAFCVVRPPGHHAGAERGMGFCIFNNVAVAARYAQKKHGIGKVLIADWDVHHGNGTQDIFYEDGSVFFFSTHQSPWYPGTGKATETGTGKGKGCILNCPFPAGAGRKEIVGAFKDKLLQAAKVFKPEMVLISAGFDSRQGDPLGRFTLSDADFSELTGIMLEVAGEYAGGRLVSVLEGGYNLPGLASAAEAHVRTLCGAG